MSPRGTTSNGRSKTAKQMTPKNALRSTGAKMTTLSGVRRALDMDINDDLNMSKDDVIVPSSVGRPSAAANRAPPAKPSGDVIDKRKTKVTKVSAQQTKPSGGRGRRASSVAPDQTTTRQTQPSSRATGRTRRAFSVAPADQTTRHQGRQKDAMARELRRLTSDLKESAWKPISDLPIGTLVPRQNSSSPPRPVIFVTGTDLEGQSKRVVSKRNVFPTLKGMGL